MKKKIAVYPGSFDPVTFGHLDIIDRASKIFDHLIVSVFVNSAKAPMFTVAERVLMLKAVLKGRKNVTIDCFEGLLVDYVRRKKTKVVVRGLRAISDLEHEFQIAGIIREATGLEIKHRVLRYDGRPFEPQALAKEVNSRLGII